MFSIGLEPLTLRKSRTGSVEGNAPIAKRDGFNIEKFKQSVIVNGRDT